MKPEAGQWWETEFGRIYAVGPMDDGTAIVVHNEAGFIWTVSPEKFEAWTHLVSCTGWNWVAPEQPQPAEDPDEWVILDPVKYADHVLRWNIDFTNTRTGWEPITNFAGDTISDILNDYECTNVVFRCRRRDLPKVEQVEQAKQCISHDEHRGEWRCKNAALPGKDYCSECADDPQPQKTRVRLWKNAYGSVMSNPDCENIEGWREIHHDSEGFYTID